MTEAPRAVAPPHILLLADRDWTHPQGGGSGANLYAQVARWIAWGHRVTMVTGTYPGAKPVEELCPTLTIHRMGGRTTVFARTIWSVLRGVGRDADVVLEVVNGIPYFTPLWLRKPCVALVHHVHRDLYIGEFGRLGKFLSWALETLPLRYIYRGIRFLTISKAARDDLVELGIPEEDITVAYLGVERGHFRRGTRAPTPRLLFVGRLKAYKRIEHVLDVLEHVREHVPGASLDIVGDGDHRPALEHEIERRGLTERITLHGHVSEERKIELYGAAWVSLTASSSEGWSLTVMEAALCGTPSAALAVGGLPESVVDDETGVLADTPEHLAERVREVVEHPELRERLGSAAEVRAKQFTWEKTSAANISVLVDEARSARQALGAAFARSATARGAAVAAATLAGHAMSLIFTVVFARMLGASGYGSLAALVSAFIVLSIPGSALQVAVARETAEEDSGQGVDPAGTVRGWTRTLALACLVLSALGVVLREPLATLLAVSQSWAAAALPLTGGLWLLVSMQRGALQGVGAYGTVGRSILLEGAARLGLGIGLVVAGAGATGAFLGTPASLLAIAVLLAVHPRWRGARPARPVVAPRLRDLFGHARWPVIGLTLLAVLPNVDVIAVKHGIGGSLAGSYAAAAVAAKTLVWIAVGVGLYLLPEATRLAAVGRDPRRALRRSLLVVGSLSVPLLALFAVAPHLILSVAFGHELARASGQLPVLALAMALLGAGCLAVQYMLALARVSFVPVLAAVAILEPALLAGISDLPGFVAVLLAVQCVFAASLLALSFRPARPRRPAT